MKKPRLRLLALPFALASSSVFATAPLDRAATLAAQLGAPIADSALRAPATPPTKPLSAQKDASEAASGPISGYASVSGSGSVNCSGGANGDGWMSAWVTLRGDVHVSTNDGASGRVPVSGSVHLSGSCRRGSGSVSGNASLSGSGTLYKNGRPAGRAQMSGSVFISQYVSGSFLWINQSVYLSGHFDAN